MAAVRSSSSPLPPSSSNDLVMKSPTDKRLYRILRLPNGLSALLVHDPEIFPDGFDGGDPLESSRSPKEDEEVSDGDDCEEDSEEEEERAEEKKKRAVSTTKKAAAAMCVGMGSFSDPCEAQGLAHFLEHMLFMGNSEFPDENEYDSYLSKHGGSSNAYTETEYTCYHFEVNREFLKGALKRFAQFFISPLVKAEAMEREVLAVDSEFNQALQSDSCRLLQLQCHTSPPGHPFNRFFWGNKKSLADAIEKGVNLREEILQLYRENYYGGIMKLVIIGGESLDILEDWVLELFSNVREGKKSFGNNQNNLPIWTPGKLYRLEAVKDVHVLELTWSLPCLHKEYLKKAEDYLAHLLGHEGRGSLLYFLKAKGWASSLSAGVGDEGMRRSSVAYVFVMSVHLTDSGLDKFQEVIGVVYQYLKLLRQTSPQEWIFKELQDIGNMDFRFAEEQPQDDYAAELAENMLFYPDEHIIYGEYAFEEWDAKLIEHILSFFSPEYMRIDILSKSFDKYSQVIQSEPWFGSRYIDEDIPEPLSKLWRNPPEIDPALHLPLKNEYIPSDFSIRSAVKSEVLENVEYPKCIVDQPLIKVWYKHDRTFKVPRANTYFLIAVKEGYTSTRNFVLTELFVNLLKDELNEILYQAGVAKLETALTIVGDKLELKLYGFNDKLSTLLCKILTVSRSFIPSSDRFKVIKEDMERAFKNANMKPLNHSAYLRLQLLRENFWDVDDRLACLRSLSLSDLTAFIPGLLSQLHIEGLCHGNLSEEEAIHISDIFRSTFPVQPLPADQRHQERVLSLPAGERLVRSTCVKNESEVNSVVELYFQIEQDTGPESNRRRALADLFGSIIEEPCFDQLRTKEQLGYVVESGSRMTYRILGFCFRIQSSEYSPSYLHGRLDSFINGLQELLDGLDNESFEKYRNGLISEKLEKDPSLSYETSNHWHQIVDKRYLFDMAKIEAEELKTIQKREVIEWYNTYMRPPSSKCRWLAIHVWGCNTKRETHAQFGRVVEDVAAFKASMNFYPSLC
ncbi:Zinc-metallopeptidase, peroxisomal [Acorus gramineus]|uniref:Zinc-metallopeptidase, peroxisomal n=1 Tax=Acorus gramineus TaxID=55184 RepID=A0AAV9B3J9_ACOGR|nr:Zinc-metallopeptidase, peroxisomal [Acorus gramineus]